MGVERVIAGRFSYDNIIEETFGPLYMLWTAIESKNVKARDSSQADVKEKRWKEQTGVERSQFVYPTNAATASSMNFAVSSGLLNIGL